MTIIFSHLKSPCLLSCLTQRPPCMRVWGKAQRSHDGWFHCWWSFPDALSCGSNWSVCSALQTSSKEEGKEARLGEPVTLALRSPNTSCVQAEPKTSHVEGSMLPGAGLPGAPSSPKPRWTEGARRPSAGGRVWRRRCRVSSGAAQPPQPKLKRAPLWKLPRTAP